jgi:hypothetical protein
MFLNFTHPSTNPKEPTQKNKKVTEHKNLWKDKTFLPRKRNFLEINKLTFLTKSKIVWGSTQSKAKYDVITYYTLCQ